MFPGSPLSAWRCKNLYTFHAKARHKILTKFMSTVLSQFFSSKTPALFTTMSNLPYFVTVFLKTVLCKVTRKRTVELYQLILLLDTLVTK